MNRLGNIIRVLVLLIIMFLIQYYIGINEKTILIYYVCVSIVEELLKFLFVIDKDNLNDVIEIVIFFSMAENLLYCSHSGNMFIHVLLLRTVTSMSLHLFCTIIAYIGFKKGYTILGLIIAITTHTVYNLYCEHNLGTLVIPPAVIIFIYIFFNRKSLTKLFYKLTK